MTAGTDRERIFQVGMYKCGTTSIRRFFQAGSPGLAHAYGAMVAERMERNVSMGNAVLQGVENFDVYTDMNSTRDRDRVIVGGEFYARILRDYPGSRFILNTRDEERWLRSMVGNRGDTFPALSDDEYMEMWRLRRSRLHERIVRDIPPDRLLVFDIEAGSPVELCRFAGLPDSCASNWTQANRSPSKFWMGVIRRIPRPLKNAVPYGLRIRIRERLG